MNVWYVKIVENKDGYDFYWRHEDEKRYRKFDEKEKKEFKDWINKVF